MFSSLASFIFGSNTSATANSEPNNHPIGQQEEDRLRQFTDENLVRLDAENTIHVTSSTPSVTGCHNDSILIRERGSGRISQGGKRAGNNSNSNSNNNNKGKRNKSNRNKRQQLQQQEEGGQKARPSLAKLLTPNESCDEDLDEEEWFIVEKEDEDDSLPRTDSEEELSVVEIKGNTIVASASPSVVVQTALTSNNHNDINDNNVVALQSERQQQPPHRHQHINSHSLYSGPRPQQQRNLLQRARNNARSAGVPLNAATLNPPRNIANDAGTGNVSAVDADCIAHSLYVARHKVPSSSPLSSLSPLPSSPSTPSLSPSSSLPLAAACVQSGSCDVGMEESWFVTPPPCFTSIGPINMETSPYENLLIEHPSMSVYHSIRSAQEATESFVNLDLGVGESRPTRRHTTAAAVSATAIVVGTTNNGDRSVQAATPQKSRTSNARSERFSAAQLKQELFARSTQKSHDKKERQNLCRGAIKRANKVRDFQSKSNRQRRSDMQHCKILSGVNNNRKCCF